MRSRVLIALHFLTWLDSIDLTLAELTQAHVDQWLDDGTTYHYTLRPFLAWARDRRLVGDVEVPSLPVGAPEARYPEQVQWQQLRRCLNDTAMPLEVRFAGSLLLLFGISASRQVQLRAEAIEPTDTTTHLRVAQQALPLPPRLADIAIQQRDRTDLRSHLRPHRRHRHPMAIPRPTPRPPDGRTFPRRKT